MKLDTAIPKSKVDVKLYFLRKCDYCNKGLSKGYVWGNGEGYGCNSCYTTHLINWTLELVDDTFFIESDDKEEFIIEVTDQIYVGWNYEENDGQLYDFEGNEYEIDNVARKDVVYYEYADDECDVLHHLCVHEIDRKVEE